MRRFILRATVVLAAAAILLSTIFTVDETQTVVVLKLGKPVRVIEEPGMKFKWPTPIQTLMRFDNRVAVFAGRPSEFLTHDKKNIVVESFACWRIKDAQHFLESVKNPSGAEIRLGDMISSEIGAALGTVPLHALISVDPQAVQLDSIMGQVLANCAKKAEANYGIEVVAVNLKRLNFPEQNKIAVYNRMRSERERIAKKYRAEGSEQAAVIRAETDKEVSRILSEAYRDAEKVKGEGDAQAAKIYADAYKTDPGFYKMTRTLESYGKFLDEQTTIVLSSDAQLLRLLGEGSGQ